MSNIWMDKLTLNNENSHYESTKSKQLVQNGSRSVKKQAFGEIKNVMHNQMDATPFKGNGAKIDGIPGISSAKSLCTEVLRKQQMKQNFADAENKLVQKNKSPSITEHYEGPVFDEGLFDAWDIDRECCKNQKSDMEIWSEMEMLNFNLADCKIEEEDEEDHKIFEVTDLMAELDELGPMSFDLDPMEDVNFDYGDLPNINEFNFEVLPF